MLAEFFFEERRFPEDIQTYYEPFVGGGAVYFFLWRKGLIRNALLSDVNFDLINVYQNIKDDVYELIDRSSEMDLATDPETYYKNRARFNELKLNAGKSHDELLERAILMIYLNHTGYSGMYRENSQGLFNIPYGNYRNPTIIDEDNLLTISRAFENVEFKVGDFQQILKYRRFKPNDFVYLDPPYMTDEEGKGFTSYTKSGFGESDQQRLAECFKRLSDRDVKVMLSNSSSSKIEELYRDIRKIRSDDESVCPSADMNLSITPIEVYRGINNLNRGPTTVAEYLILNY